MGFQGNLPNMKVLLIAALCATALAVPNGRRLRPEEHWRPAGPRDLSKYRPRSELFSQASSSEFVSRPTSRRSVIPRPSKYNLAAECGEEGPSKKIVGGEEATPNQWPWIVALFVDNAWFCGGSLISENWVMTAAHCVDGALYFDILAGAHNVRESSEPHRVEITSFNGFTHESWDTSDLSNDIALIELPSPITFNDYIKPSCLPAPGNTADVGDMVSVIGWGRPSDSASGISPVLRMVHDIPVMSNRECNSYYGIVKDGVVCIDTTGGRGSCNGDSGGPLIDEVSSGKWNQVGVVSFGSTAGCEVGAPAGFTRTEYYLDWISSNAAIKY